MDTLARSDFLEHFTGEMFLSQYAGMEKLDPPPSGWPTSGACDGPTVSGDPKDPLHLRFEWGRGRAAAPIGEDGFLRDSVH